MWNGRIRRLTQETRYDGLRLVVSTDVTSLRSGPSAAAALAPTAS
jgi:hypothetical protein